MGDSAMTAQIEQLIGRLSDPHRHQWTGAMIAATCDEAVATLRSLTGKPEVEGMAKRLDGLVSVAAEAAALLRSLAAPQEQAVRYIHKGVLGEWVQTTYSAEMFKSWEPELQAHYVPLYAAPQAPEGWQLVLASLWEMRSK
jgi:hypothetical protein